MRVKERDRDNCAVSAIYAAFGITEKQIFTIRLSKVSRKM
jgi:hypothetical protein